MTIEEAQRLFRVPGGDGPNPGEDGNWLGPTETWAGADVRVFVQYDGHGRVMFHEVRPE